MARLASENVMQLNHSTTSSCIKKLCFSFFKSCPCLFYLVLHSLCFASTTECRPEVFKSTNLDDSNGSLHKQTSQEEENEVECSDDEGLPPIEANTNRIKPFEVQSDVESDSSSDKDS
jgi:hypothetical protein